MESLILYGISAFAIVLGFIALLTQKIYIHENDTGKETEVEVPLLGKIKTNYPALVFVVLGFGTAVFVFDRTREKKKVKWDVQGTLVDPNGKVENWMEGELKVVPSNFDIEIDAQGKFTIQTILDEDKTFEDAIEVVIYSHKNGWVQFVPKESPLLNLKTGHFRSYKPITLENNN